MTTLSALVAEYIKKHDIKTVNETYLHTYEDGSTILFNICNGDKDILLREMGEDWNANVPTKQLMVTVKTDTFPNLDWFDGKRFRTVQSAIKAIKKECN